MRQSASPAQTVDWYTDGQAWIRSLRGNGAERDRALSELHVLLLRAARFELSRRRSSVDAGEGLDDLAVQSADNALNAILAKLDSYRFESRFTTWAYKFAILEAATLARRRAWQARELPVDPQAWGELAIATRDLTHDLAVREQLREITRAIQTELTPHQREVLTALVLREVPIDVLAERLNTTRGALYKTLHDARRKLRKVTELEQDD